MRSSAIVFVAALVSSVVAAPVALAPRTSTNCWPGCSASNPNPSVQAGLGLTVQVGLWATVDVPRIIAQLQAAINAGNAAACSTAQTALLDLRAKINVAATLNTVDVITARTCSALVVKVDAAVKAAVDVDAAALVTVDATVKAIASLQAAIAANAVADVSASITALVALRAKLVVALSATVGTTRDRCQDAIGQIDVSAQLCLDIVAHISAQLDAAVRANVDADVKVALSLVAQLRAALKVGVNAGAAFGDNCKSALVKLDVSIAACLTIIINAAKVAVGGAVRATIQASVDILVLAKACLDVNVSIFASLTAVLGSCTRALGQ